MNFNAMLENWRIRGAPRCYAHDFKTNNSCWKVIWPWQKTGGDGEHAQHWECMLKERESLGNFDDKD